MRQTPCLIFYDGQCGICRRGRQMIERFRPTAPVRFVDSNDALEMARHPQMNARGQMYVLEPAGRLSGGGGVVVAAAAPPPPRVWGCGFFFSSPAPRAWGGRGTPVAGCPPLPRGAAA